MKVFCMLISLAFGLGIYFELGLAIPCVTFAVLSVFLPKAISASEKQIKDLNSRIEALGADVSSLKTATSFRTRR